MAGSATTDDGDFRAIVRGVVEDYGIVMSTPTGDKDRYAPLFVASRPSFGFKAQSPCKDSTTRVSALLRKCLAGRHHVSLH